MDVENLYMVDVPEFEGEKISYAESNIYDDGAEYEIAETDVYIEPYDEADIYMADSTVSIDVLSEVDVAESERIIAEVLQEEVGVLPKHAFFYEDNELEIVEPSYEPINDSVS